VKSAISEALEGAQKLPKDAQKVRKNAHSKKSAIAKYPHEC